MRIGLSLGEQGPLFRCIETDERLPLRHAVAFPNQHRVDRGSEAGRHRDGMIGIDEPGGIDQFDRRPPRDLCHGYLFA